MAFEDLTLQEKIEYSVLTLFNKARFYGQFIQGKVSGHMAKEIAVTNGLDIRFGKVADEKLNEEEFLFVLAHEVQHIMLGHCCKENDELVSNHSVANIVQDIVINSILMYSKNKYGLENYKCSPPKIGFNPEVDFSNTAWIDLYKQYMSQIKDIKMFEVVEVTLVNDKGEEWNIGKTQLVPKGYKMIGEDGEWYEHENCGLEMDKNKLEMELIRAKNITEQYGNETCGAEEILGKLFSNKIDWRILFRNTVNSIINKTEISFMSPKRNMLHTGYILPGKRKQKRKESSDVNIYIDTSGSMDNKTLMEILGECEFITKKYKKEGKVIFWDTEVYEPITLEEVTRKENIKVSGRGGTNINCVVNSINKNKERELNIIASDGYFNADIKLEKNEEIIWLIYGRRKGEFSVKGKGKHTVIYID